MLLSSNRLRHFVVVAHVVLKPAAEQALRCRDASLSWCLKDTARWDLVQELLQKGKQLAAAEEHDAAVKKITQARKGIHTG